MDLNEKFQEICNECGGVKKMQKAFDDFIKNQIKVGSIVRVQDWNQNYPTCCSWFIDNHIPKQLCVRYAYNKKMCSNEYDKNTIFKVLAVHDEKALIVLNEPWNSTSCYLVGTEALVVVTK